MKRVAAHDFLVVSLLLLPAVGCRTLPMVSQPTAPRSLSLPPRSEGEASETTARQERSLPAPKPLTEPIPASPPPQLLDEPEEGASVGLTLDQAIERLVTANLDLAVKYQDIPKARADVLTAGLRNDPVMFLTAAPIPYNRFSPQRPGATQYDVTLVQTLDLSGKRRTNKRVAEKNISVLEAHYQDGVRLEIDRLFTTYVNVLEARAAVQAARARLKRLAGAAERCGELVHQGRRAPSDRTRLALRQAAARIALQQAEASLLHARRNLSVLLALPPGEAEHLHLCGSLRDRAPPPPPTDELIRIARQARPDLLALQLSVDRAHAELRREKAEAVDDLFLFFSPYQATDLTPQGKLVANAWEMGVMIPIPSLNRNQGEIRRAQVNVVQWRSEVERAEQEILDEVRRAATEYTVSRQAVEQYERDILPSLGHLRDQRYRRFDEEQGDLGSFLSAQRDYDEAVLSFVEALARHRRSMLRLNTVVGQRILP